MSLRERMRARSLMTSRQLELLRQHLDVMSGAIKLREAATNAEGGSISIGAYCRVVTQGREKLKRSVVTIVLGIWLGYLKIEDLRRLFELVASGNKDLDEENQRRLVVILGDVVDRIVV